jgi:hypothetical protein
MMAFKALLFARIESKSMLSYRDVYRSAKTAAQCSATRHQRPAINSLLSISMLHNSVRSIYTDGQCSYLNSVNDTSFSPRLSHPIKHGTRTGTERKVTLTEICDWKSECLLNGVHRLCVPNGVHRLCVPNYVHRLCVPNYVHRLCVPNEVHRLCVHNYVHRLCLPNEVHRLCVPNEVHRLRT